jgi:hypothetical protein
VSANGGAAIWAIAPYDAARRQVRATVEPEAGFVVDTSLLSAEPAADRVPAHLQAEGYLSGAAAGG